MTNLTKTDVSDRKLKIFDIIKTFNIKIPCPHYDIISHSREQ